MNYNHEVNNGKFARQTFFGRMKARISVWVTRFIEFLKTWLIRSAIVSAFGWAVFAGYMLNELNGTELVAYADTVTLPGIELKGKSVEDLKAEVIHDLASKENGDGTELPVYLDDNSKGSLPRKDKVSVGCMAFKISTVQRHFKAIHGKELNNLEAVLLALDCDKAKELAKEAIFGELNAIGEWMGATEKMKIKVSLIREML